MFNINRPLAGGEIGHGPVNCAISKEPFGRASDDSEQMIFTKICSSNCHKCQAAENWRGLRAIRGSNSAFQSRLAGTMHNSYANRAACLKSEFPRIFCFQHIARWLVLQTYSLFCLNFRLLRSRPNWIRCESRIKACRPSIRRRSSPQLLERSVERVYCQKVSGSESPDRLARGSPKLGYQSCSSKTGATRKIAPTTNCCFGIAESSIREARFACRSIRRIFEAHIEALQPFFETHKSFSTNNNFWAPAYSAASYSVSFIFHFCLLIFSFL